MKFNELRTEDQEKVFGRYKASGKFMMEPPEMPEKLPNAHTTRMFIPTNPEAMGAEFLPLNIFRQPGSYHHGAESGLYFLAYARSAIVFEMMLASMLGNSPQKQPDSLLDWVTPKTGQYWYIPSQQQLIDMAKQNYNPNKSAKL
eukprot:Phypoly_transcript_25398.p1 GENE.Phypoly_transcript_25398~~Phypoly_transcript_25398.p1  ORF type:complete len:159 (+),score=24.10 Phypoly_transcript_25398:48-479(+)